MQKYWEAIENEDVDEMERQYVSGNRDFTDELLADALSTGNLGILNFVADRFPNYRNDMYQDSWDNFLADPEKYRNHLRWAVSRGWKDFPQLYQVVRDALIGDELSLLQILGEEGIIRPVVDQDGNLTDNGKLRKAYFDSTVPVPRYPGTGRPKLPTDTHTSCSSRLPTQIIPVSRYDGLYYGIQPGFVGCGTFYFYEPAGDWFLSFDRIFICGNKVHASYTLETAAGVPPDQTAAFRILKSMDLINFYCRILQGPQDPAATVLTQAVSETIVVQMNPYYEAEGKYIGNAYLGNFDDLDQPICQLARKAGYDVVLLQREPGETRVVTEILDVRDRQVSSQSICLGGPLELKPLQAAKPAIWYP